MAEDTTASVISLYQEPAEPKLKAKGVRAKTSRQRKRKAKPLASKTKAIAADDADLSSEEFIPADYVSADWVVNEPSVEPSSVEVSEPATPARRPLVATMLSVAAIGLAGAGIAMNGWFARSLGSSDVASWLFLAVGVGADLVALAMPSCAAGLWRERHRATACVGWSVWLMTFVFAVTAGIGFASTNIADVTLARAARSTPAIVAAQSALADAMIARDRECKGGVGKFCREREAAVVERRQILDSAMTSIAQKADPQTDAAIKVVTWISRGTLRPASDDFAMLRLVLLSLLPQIGGILLLVGRGGALGTAAGPESPGMHS